MDLTIQQLNDLNLCFLFYSLMLIEMMSLKWLNTMRLKLWSCFSSELVNY